MRSSMLNWSKIFPGKEDDVMKLEKNDLKMVRWVCNVNSENWISAVKLSNRLPYIIMREC